MYLKKSFNKKRNKTQLSFVQGYRIDGKVKHKVIKNLGYLEDYLDQYEDPIAHFQQIAKEWNADQETPDTIEVSLSEKLPDQCFNRKNLGYAIIKLIYSKLQIREFFQNKQRQLPVEYNLNSVFSLLTFNRFLFPSSKKNAYETKDRFFDSFNFSLDDVYRALGYFNRYSQELQKHLHDRVSSLVGRNSEKAYYDVTNYYFEIPYEDEDSPDMERTVKRKKGPSKEHRKDPIIQMGLLMDSNGIPMAFHTFSGNESEKTNMLPAIQRVKKDYEIGRIIVIADRGLNTSDNTSILSGPNASDEKNNDGYVYGQSIRGADTEFKRWVLEQDGYITTMEKNKDGEEIPFKHKSRLYAKEITKNDSNGVRRLKMTIYQKQLVYYSEKYAKKQKYEREKAVAKAMDLVKNPANYTKATSQGCTAYINHISFSKDTGEIANGKELSINEEKIAEEALYDGYYSIVTSEKELSDKEIRDIYKGLWEIEESFKIIKSEFKTRPVFVSTEDHIQAHFLICFVTLVIMRVLEQLIGKCHSVRQIRDSLVNYSCSYLDQNYYLFDYRDDVILTMEKAFGLDLSKKIMPLSEIKRISRYTG
ncbi:MAG: IS1634 family transposase [Dorea sp.]|nr:IS1634 family transposase [Dorea sp.]